MDSGMALQHGCEQLHAAGLVAACPHRHAYSMCISTRVLEIGVTSEILSMALIVL